MLNAFREGGWGMYPTLIVGLIALASAVRFAWQANAKLRGFINAMSLSAAMCGLTGFVTGLISTGSYIGKRELKGQEALLTLLMGTKESMNNLALALLLLAIIFVVIAIGQRRIDVRSNP